jgi:hypothetical protein
MPTSSTNLKQSTVPEQFHPLEFDLDLLFQPPVVFLFHTATSLAMPTATF